MITISFTSCFHKQNEVKLLFQNCLTSSEKYEKIIELGRNLPPYPDELKVPQHSVSGCQSILYLHARLANGTVRFQTHSEALISAGLAALLLAVYNDELPEVILKCPPHYLEELGIPASLSPSRSNGLASLFFRMKQEAVALLN